MMETISQQPRVACSGRIWIIPAVWFILNMIQAVVTGLFDDEALYWMYGEHLDWGYYEHPPMVALLIKTGYTLFSNVAGVRIFFVLISTVAIYLILILSDTRNYLLSGGLIFSTLIATAGGFIAAPDGPLLLFSVLYFLLYRKFLQQEDTVITILWGVVMAGLLYSKYNGLLVIILTFLSNTRLFARKRFYLATGTAVILLIPHLIWQIQHDFPTFRYHLFERSIHQDQSVTYLIEYVAGQAGIYGPVIAVFLFWFTFSYTTTDLFERALKYTATGFLLFFLFYSLRGRIEPNWTLPALAPLLILSIRALDRLKRLHLIIHILTAISILMMIGFRVYMVHDYLRLPKKLVNLTELHRKSEWAGAIAQQAGNHPVIFLNSYQDASKYIFYTGRPAFPYYKYDNHLTQYNFWNDMIDHFQGDTVMVVDRSEWSYLPGKKVLQFPSGDSLFFCFEPHFQSFSTVPVKVSATQQEFPAGKEVSIPVRIENNSTTTLQFGRDASRPVYLVYSIHQEGRPVTTEQVGAEITWMNIPNQEADTLIRVLTPEQTGEYELYVSVKSGWLPAGQNGKRYRLTVF